MYRGRCESKRKRHWNGHKHMINLFLICCMSITYLYEGMYENIPIDYYGDDQKEKHDRLRMNSGERLSARESRSRDIKNLHTKKETLKYTHTLWLSECTCGIQTIHNNLLKTCLVCILQFLWGEAEEENYQHTHIKFTINQFIERALKILSDIFDDFQNSWVPL